jgi:hypothetical protein
MSTLQINLPDSVRKRVEYFASEEGVSTDDFLATIITQRVAVAEADSYIRRRGSRGSAERMLEMLKRVPDVEPESYDRIPKDEEPQS